MLHKPPRLHTYKEHHTPCTHKRHRIPHTHEWVNNVLSIGDSFENTDRVIKRLHITIKFASFTLSWIYYCYMAISSGESKDVCFNTRVRGPLCNTYIYISNNGHLLLLVHGLTIMAKQFEYHNMTPLQRSWCGVYSLSACIFNNTGRIHFIFTHVINQLQTMCRVKHVI